MDLNPDQKIRIVPVPTGYKPSDLEELRSAYQALRSTFFGEAKQYAVKFMIAENSMDFGTANEDY